MKAKLVANDGRSNDAQSADEPATPLEGDRFMQLFRWMTAPSFGSWSKREVELKVLELRYGSEHRKLGQFGPGHIASELRVSRAKARQFLLEIRSRIDRTDEERRSFLRTCLEEWVTASNLVDRGERLQVLVDDPYLRDLLRTFAYDQRIVLDGSFSAEVITLNWKSLAELLQALVPDQDGQQRLVESLRKSILATAPVKGIEDLRNKVDEAAAPTRTQRSFVGTMADLAQIGSLVLQAAAMPSVHDRMAAAIAVIMQRWG